MANPIDLNVGSVVKWTIPEDIRNREGIDSVNIYRSTAENMGYELLTNIPYDADSAEYVDLVGNRSWFYLVTFVSSTPVYESPYHITYFNPLPNELRMISFIRSSMPDIIKTNDITNALTEYDYLVGLTLAVQLFNTYPPATNFRLDRFPKNYEFFIIGLAQMVTITAKYLPISVRDWSYSEPGGVTMQIDRGAKFNQALDIITKVYTQYVPLIKMDFASELPVGLGTIQLPLGMGGIVSRGLLNVLDIFTAAGR